MKLSHGIKWQATQWDIQNKENSRLAGGNRFVLEAVAFFCHPAWRILYHVTVSCKEQGLNNARPEPGLQMPWSCPEGWVRLESEYAEFPTANGSEKPRYENMKTRRMEINN